MTKQECEINFWRDLINSKPDYREYRVKDIEKYRFLYDELIKETGKGLDYGCGPMSMLSASGLKFTACDPLIDEYRELIDLGDEYTAAAKGKFAWAWCVNVIDHADDWKSIIDDLKKLLKKGGKVYFEVNFDDILTPAHSKLWRLEDVREALKDFKLIKEDIQRLSQFGQTIYQGIYEI